MVLVENQSINVEKGLKIILADVEEKCNARKSLEK